MKYIEQYTEYAGRDVAQVFYMHLYIRKNKAQPVFESDGVF